MDSDYEIKTRVTTLDELKLPSKGDDCLVVIYAPNPRNLGKRFLLLNDSITIGRDRESDIILESDSVSRRHCRIERRNDHLVLIDLDSTNGTFVNDAPESVTNVQLRRGDQIKVGDTIFKHLSGSDVEAQYHETIYRMTITDGLTSVHNKRYLHEVLEREIPRAQRHGRDLSLMMLDIDHFKQVNDTYGHLAGDAVLRDMAGIIKGRLRPDDVFGRYGGEEFAVILPETPIAGAARIAEDLRARVASHPFMVEDERISVTLSIGVAELEPDTTADQLFKVADERLYTAKREGRNRVCFK